MNDEFDAAELTGPAYELNSVVSLKESFEILLDTEGLPEEREAHFNWDWRVRSIVPSGEDDTEDGGGTQIPKALFVDVVVGLIAEASQAAAYNLETQLMGTFAAIRPDEDWPDDYPSLHEFVSLSAVSTLMPYLRQRVSDLSGQGPYPPYFLPNINVPELMETFNMQRSTGWQWLEEYKDVAHAFGIHPEEFE